MHYEDSGLTTNTIRQEVFIMKVTTTVWIACGKVQSVSNNESSSDNVPMMTDEFEIHQTPDIPP